MNTDPIADMLTRIRNGGQARLGCVAVPHSNVKVKIAEILKDEGYIVDYEVAAGSPGAKIDVTLKYDKKGVSVIEGIQRVSKPGLRKYLRSREIPKVRNGLGILIMSTSHGMMTDSKARKEGVGGEPLCSVW